MWQAGRSAAAAAGPWFVSKCWGWGPGGAARLLLLLLPHEEEKEEWRGLLQGPGNSLSGRVNVLQRGGEVGRLRNERCGCRRNPPWCNAYRSDRGGGALLEPLLLLLLLLAATGAAVTAVKAASPAGPAAAAPASSALAPLPASTTAAAARA